MEQAETLKDLIVPVTVEDFFERYWEKSYLHLQNDEQRFARYFSVHEIDRWLSSNRASQPNSLVVTRDDGEQIATTRYRHEDVGMALAYEVVAQQSSLVVNYLADHHAISGLVKALAKEFHADVGVNAYFTPRNARTFPIHTDDHDVLVLHLEGEKIWHLHELSILQLNLKQKKNLQFPKEWYKRNDTPEIAEIRLTPGDVLYIPRGMPHYAVATDTACLHLTISITSLSWMDFIKVAAEHVAAHSPRFRRTLPPGFVSDEALCEQMRQLYTGVMEAFQEHATFDEVLAVVKRNRVTFQAFPVDGHLEQVLRVDELHVESRLERRRDILCVVDEVLDAERNKKSAIFFGPQRVVGPLFLRRALDFICTNSRFLVSEIPGLDEQGQLTIARRLIREGLLRFAPASGSGPVLE